MRTTHFLLALLISVAAFADEIPWPEHPRPDFQRPTWANLNGKWDFAFDPEDSGEKQGWFKPGEHKFDRQITVPFPWESKLSGIGDKPYQGIAWYSRSVTIPKDKEWTEHDPWLVIGACDWSAKVWVNGQLAGQHVGGYVPFEFNLAKFCKPGEKVSIIIRAEDRTDRQQPTGKQIGWYTHTSGIWQTVYIEPRASTFIRSLRITTDIKKGDVKCVVTVEGETKGVTVFASSIGAPPSRPAGAILADKTGSSSFSLDPFRLWSPDSPTLYPVVVTLHGPKGHGAIDQVESYFGFREIGVGDAPNKEYQYICLNGKPIYLRGALHQSFHPEGVYEYPDDATMRNDYEICREVGINFLRIHIKAPIPRELYWADKLGIMIMQDMPNFWQYSEQSRQWYEEMVPQVVSRDFNHPAIWCWVNFNETWGIGHNGDYGPERQEWVKNIFQRTKKLDPSRLVEDNSPCGFDHVVTDINSWHFYIDDYKEARDHISEVVKKTQPGSTFNFVGGRRQGREPLINSEYGGISSGLGDQDISWCFKYLTNELRKHEKIGGYIYTELSDIEWEHNGFVNYDRSAKEFGYDYWHPGFSVRDLNNPDFVVVDAEPCVVLKSGQTREIAVAISHWSDREAKELQLRHRLNWSPEQPQAEWEVEKAAWSPYRVVQQKSITLRAPGHVDEDMLGSLCFELTDGQQTIARNYINVLVDGPQPRARVLDAHTLQLQFDPADYATCEWPERPTPSAKGIAREKVFAQGAGCFEYVLQLPKNLAATDLTSIAVSAELSAKAGDEKLDWPERKKPVDYPQTDGKKWPTDVRISINNVKAYEGTLADDPADARGVLSHLHQFHPGSYGWWIEAKLSGDALKPALAEIRDGQLRIRFEVSKDAQHRGGLAIFGNQLGRYPRDPRCVLTFAKPHGLPADYQSDEPITVR